ncbi:phosphotransferase enzyme family protein [Ornithobacterium rhinotracheale]
MEEIVKKFFGKDADFGLQKNEMGHINTTYVLRDAQGAYVLQKFNTNIFEQPEVIVENMLKLADHLEAKKYPHAILRPKKTVRGDYLVEGENGVWRVIPFIENTQCIETVESPEQAYEVAKFIGEFHSYVCDLDVEGLKEPIPGFINFAKRMQDYEQSLNNATPNRKELALEAITIVEELKEIPKKWLEITSQDGFPKRLIHADPKISNILLSADDKNKPVAVIDLDTLMPGTILYDFGDMVRSYTNTRDEDDPTPNNFSKENYEAIKKGFLENLKDKLTPQELENFDLAGATVVYIQAVRFLTDFLNGDVYYAVKRENHNLDRTMNQLNLLKGILDATHVV